MTSRRGFLTGLGSLLVAAPAIVRASSLMPVKTVETFEFSWASHDFMYPMLGLKPEWEFSPIDQLPTPLYQFTEEEQRIYGPIVDRFARCVTERILAGEERGFFGEFPGPQWERRFIDEQGELQCKAIEANEMYEGLKSYAPGRAPIPLSKLMYDKARRTIVDVAIS